MTALAANGKCFSISTWRRYFMQSFYFEAKQVSFFHPLPKTRTYFYGRLIDGAARIFPTSNAATGNWTHISSVAPTLKDFNPRCFIDWATVAVAVTVTGEANSIGLDWPKIFLSGWRISRKCRSRPGNGFPFVLVARGPLVHDPVAGNGPFRIWKLRHGSTAAASSTRSRCHRKLNRFCS